MIPADAIRHTSFPVDGKLYWLRWMDGISVQSPSGTAAINCQICELDAGVSDVPTLAEVAVVRTPTIQVPVVVGSLPAMRLGAIYRDGVVVGDLPMQALVPTLFGRPSMVVPVQCDDENARLKPAWWTRPWKVLPFTRYPLGRFSAARCVQLWTEDVEVLISCSEVFRVLCAPETALANALCGAPWSVTCGQVVNEALCDGYASPPVIALRKGITACSAVAVASYLWTDHGRRVADAFTATRMDRSTLRHLVAAIPFEAPSIEVAGEGLDLSTSSSMRSFLMLRISRLAFPDGIEGLPEAFEYLLENYYTERRGPADVDDHRAAVPIIAPTFFPDAETGRADASHVEPPAWSATTTEVSVPPLGVIGLPTVTRAALQAPSGNLPARLVHVHPSPTYVGSTARKQRGLRDVAGLSHSPAGPASTSSFAGIVDVLERLKAVDRIASWAATPSDKGRTLVVDGLPAWALPQTVAGSAMRFARLRSGRNRTCVVADIEFRGRMVHWLEIERELLSRTGAPSAEAFRLVLLEVSADRRAEVVDWLLAQVARRDGVWPESAVGCRMFRISHRYEDVSASSTYRTMPMDWVEAAFETFVGGSAKSVVGQHIDT